MTKNPQQGRERAAAPSGPAAAGSTPPDSGSLAESSLAGSSAVPTEDNRQDEGHNRTPGNDQREGLDKAEAMGKKPARP